LANEQFLSILSEINIDLPAIFFFF